MENAETELHYDTPFHLLIAVILSAQCTDKRVNMHTPLIFKRFPTPEDLAGASFEEVYDLIRSISFPNNKARHLIGMARKLVSDFNGEVPSETADLETLPGVGRKTANVIVSNAFGVPAIAVDTHVERVAKRLGMADETDSVLEVEKKLMRKVPRTEWTLTHHRLIFFGRYHCKAQSPQCEICPLLDLCKFGKQRMKASSKRKTGK